MPLADVAYFQEGPGILAKDFRETGIPLLRLKGVEGDYVTLDGCNYLEPEMVARKWSHFRVEAGDLLISTSASLGRVSVVTTDSAGGIPYTGLIRFKPKDERLLAGYLKAFLGSSAFVEQAESMASGSVIRHFGPSHIRQMAILLPPLDQQSAIGQVASLLDERLRLLRQTNVTLESIAQALFKSWFIDFDPVRAKAEGREPEGMDAATAALFPAEFEESALGLIPKGWQIASVAALASLRGGKQLDRGEFHEAAPNPIFGGAGEMGRTALSNAEGFVLTVGRVGAYCGQFFWHEGAAWVNNNASHVRLHQSQDGYWLHQALLNSDIDKIKKGAAQPFVSNGDIENLPIILPDAAARVAFRAVAEPLYKRQTVLADTCKALEELRDTLLPRLISGRLRLPEAQAQLEEAIA